MAAKRLVLGRAMQAVFGHNKTANQKNFRYLLSLLLVGCLAKSLEEAEWRPS
jgi:hypothetical protein